MSLISATVELLLATIISCTPCSFSPPTGTPTETALPLDVPRAGAECDGLYKGLYGGEASGVSSSTSNTVSGEVGLFAVYISCSFSLDGVTSRVGERHRQQQTNPCSTVSPGDATSDKATM